MATTLTPAQWLDRLTLRLTDRWDRVRRWRNYYRGDQDLPAGPSQHLQTYREFQSKARLNLCQLAVESMVPRLRVVGYTDGTPRGDVDEVVWGWWQAAKLDARQKPVYRRALSESEAFAIVGRHPTRPAEPRVTIETADCVVVERDPADPMVRLAALRMWHDPLAKRWMATLWLPGRRYRYQTIKVYDDPTNAPALPASQWEAVGPQKGEKSPERIPVVPFSNGDELDTPRAEFDVAMDTQDRLNLTILNRLTSERYSAFRQRWVANITLDQDPVTGEDIMPFRPGHDQVWTAGPPERAGEPETRFGDFAQTQTADMLRGVEQDMRSFAAETITPIYYLPGDLVNIGADAIAALDAGFVAKIRERQDVWGESWEEVLELCGEAVGKPRDLSSSEIRWERPETFNPAQVADYATKLRSAGYPLPIIAERTGDTPQQVARLRTEIASEQARTAALAAATPARREPEQRQQRQGPEQLELPTT